MITFDSGTTRFNYRVVGVAIEEGQVLLAQVDNVPGWILPGGRAELLETSVEAVEREMAEELGVRVRADRLLWMVENFFTLEGFNFHEIGMYYRIRIADGSPGWDFNANIEFVDGGSSWRCCWHDLDQVGDLDLRPPFLNRVLPNIPESPQHIVVRESPIPQSLESSVP